MVSRSRLSGFCVRFKANVTPPYIPHKKNGCVYGCAQGPRLPPRQEARFLTAFEELMLRWKDSEVDFFVPQLAAVLMSQGVPSKNIHVRVRGNGHAFCCHFWWRVLALRGGAGGAVVIVCIVLTLRWGGQEKSLPALPA